VEFESVEVRRRVAGDAVAEPPAAILALSIRSPQVREESFQSGQFIRTEDEVLLVDLESSVRIANESRAESALTAVRSRRA